MFMLFYTNNWWKDLFLRLVLVLISYNMKKKNKEMDSKRLINTKNICISKRSNSMVTAVSGQLAERVVWPNAVWLNHVLL